MKLEKKRIFISDLPETATEDEIRSLFGEYGNVLSVEVKERKNTDLKNQSLFFSYVNIEIDDKNLQTCFQEFNRTPWHGQYVQIQVARESFLERLKREREEAAKQAPTTSNNIVTPVKQPNETVKAKSVPNGLPCSSAKKAVSSDDSSESEESESDVELKSVPKAKAEKPSPKIIKEKTINNNKSVEQNDYHTKTVPAEESFQAGVEVEVDNDVDFVIKSNKGKTVNRDCFKIESVGNEPIIKIEKQNNKKSRDPKRSEADQKRLQSLTEMRKGYSQQRSMLQAALSNIDSKPINKITFDDNAFTSGVSKKRQAADYVEATVNKKSRTAEKKDLFDDEDEELENDNFNFEVKKQFEGKAGQQLLALQSKYKNDKRFTLDERFLEGAEDDDSQKPETSTRESNLEITLEEEKRKEYEILEQVLGKKITPKQIQENDQRFQAKGMKRFDPNMPDHAKYEVRPETLLEKKKKKRKNSVDEDNKRQETTEQPVVSKDVFYKVTNDLKETLGENKGFSLLSMFGRDAEDNEDQEMEDAPKELPRNKIADQNPFKYDSSDEEDETHQLDNKEAKPDATKPVQKSLPVKRIWTEPFFFKEDDYRLQEGLDFFKRIQSEDKVEFGELRRNLKEIVKNKVRSNLRKNAPFRKKLGGKSRRKKAIRIKKALKR